MASYQSMTSRNFTKYVYEVVDHITKTRRKVDLYFELVKTKKLYSVAALRLSRNRTYWLVGSYLCPPEDPPSVIKSMVLLLHLIRGWKKQSFIGYVVLSHGDLPYAKETAELIIREHKRSLNKDVEDQNLKKAMSKSSSIAKTMELFIRPKG